MLSAESRNSITNGVAETILKAMKAWYAERNDDEDVAKTWKHLHNVLFKKATVPVSGDIWRGDDAEGIQMVVSAELVAFQVKTSLSVEKNSYERTACPWTRS